VSNLRDGDGTADILVFFGLASVLELQLEVEDGDDLALALCDLDITLLVSNFEI